MENVCSMMPGVFRNEGIVLMRTREKIESGKVKERKCDRKTWSIWTRVINGKGEVLCFIKSQVVIWIQRLVGPLGPHSHILNTNPARRRVQFLNVHNYSLRA